MSTNKIRIIIEYLADINKWEWTIERHVTSPTKGWEWEPSCYNGLCISYMDAAADSREALKESGWDIRIMGIGGEQ